jgi:hypothetical protein
LIFHLPILCSSVYPLFPHGLPFLDTLKMEAGNSKCCCLYTSLHGAVSHNCGIFNATVTENIKY